VLKFNQLNIHITELRDDIVQNFLGEIIENEWDKPVIVLNGEKNFIHVQFSVNNLIKTHFLRRFYDEQPENEILFGSLIHQVYILE
uniref:Uncharacterized protein n=1 Tax=Romanomermis culicivorax TaxID=13658 RepID=A0A915K905_ROMCU